MIKKYNRGQHTKKYYRTNDHIYAKSLRVLDSEGKQLGVYNKYDALKIAREKALDLVEIAPLANPPVAKIIDFKKFLYQEEKKKREEKKKTKTSDTKEVRLGPFISENDLLVMTKRAREFLEAGNKVRMVVFFSGRQIIHPEFGHRVLDKALNILSDISKIERDRKLEGRKLITIISQDKKSGQQKTEDTKNEKKEN